jgi:hypothetical protein
MQETSQRSHSRLGGNKTGLEECVICIAFMVSSTVELFYTVSGKSINEIPVSVVISE